MAQDNSTEVKGRNLHMCGAPNWQHIQPKSPLAHTLIQKLPKIVQRDCRDADRKLTGPHELHATFTETICSCNFLWDLIFRDRFPSKACFSLLSTKFIFIFPVFWINHIYVEKRTNLDRAFGNPWYYSCYSANQPQIPNSPSKCKREPEPEVINPSKMLSSSSCLWTF
jgi:hypothetical protein